MENENPASQTETWMFKRHHAVLYLQFLPQGKLMYAVNLRFFINQQSNRLPNTGPRFLSILSLPRHPALFIDICLVSHMHEAVERLTVLSDWLVGGLQYTLLGP